MKRTIQAVSLVMLLGVGGVASAKGSGGGRSHGGGHSSKAATGTGSSSSRTHVSGYTSNKGKYVASHDRSSKDHTKTNNWSTKGNVNPDTGKRGTK